MAAADVYMDSAGFLALWDTDEEHHLAAVRLQAATSVLTTNYAKHAKARFLSCATAPPTP